jgi:hypothetical protein
MLSPQAQLALSLIHRGTDEATMRRIGEAYAMFKQIPEEDRARLVTEFVAAWVLRQNGNGQ